LLELPAAYQDNQAGISVSCGAFHSSLCFGQRKLKTDEPREQKQQIKLDMLLSQQDLLCTCSILPCNPCCMCRIGCSLRHGKERRGERKSRGHPPPPHNIS